MLEMLNSRLFGFWNNLTEGLKTGKPQNEAKNGESLFAALYADPQRLETFLSAMHGIQAANFAALADKFDFSRYKTYVDVGGAKGSLAVAVARKHAHLQCKSYDLPIVLPIAKRNLESLGLAQRVEAVAGDFFAEPLPNADVISMGNILHDWNLEKKRFLLKRAFDALPAGGALIAVENIIDDARRKNTFGMLMSLNMLVETGDGFDYTFADFQGWAKEAGFSRCELVPLVGPASMAIAYK